jgi:predicted nucleic acid-binding protein
LSRFVVDASVAIKWYIPEVHADAAARYLDEDHELFVPDLIYPEIGNIVWKKARRTELGDAEAREVLMALRAVPFTVYASNRLVDAAYEIARALDRTVYDSLYLALAADQGCEMVTADRRLYEVVSTSALRPHIRWIENYAERL